MPRLRHAFAARAALGGGKEPLHRRVQLPGSWPDSAEVLLALQAARPVFCLPVPQDQPRSGAGARSRAAQSDGGNEMISKSTWASISAGRKAPSSWPVCRKPQERKTRAARPLCPADRVRCQPRALVDSCSSGRRMLTGLGPIKPLSNGISAQSAGFAPGIDPVAAQPAPLGPESRSPNGFDARPATCCSMSRAWRWPNGVRRRPRLPEHGFPDFGPVSAPA